MRCIEIAYVLPVLNVKLWLIETWDVLKSLCEINKGIECVD